jgi:hypothetical protein
VDPLSTIDALVLGSRLLLAGVFVVAAAAKLWMHDDLLAWERAANGATPELVILSSGDEEATRSDSFRSRVLLDEDLAATSSA